MVWVKIDETKMSNGDLLSLASWSNNEIAINSALIMECLDVEDKLFYEAVNNVKNELYYDDNKYIIIKKAEHEKILGVLKNLYGDKFHQKIQQAKKEAGLDK